MLGEFAQYFSANPYISGVIMILLNVGTSYLMQDIMPVANRLFKYRWVRRLVFFAIFFTATRNLLISIVLTVIATMVLDMFLNEDSRFCLIPYECRQRQTTAGAGAGAASSAAAPARSAAAAATAPAAATATATIASPEHRNNSTQGEGNAAAASTHSVPEATLPKPAFVPTRTLPSTTTTAASEHFANATAAKTVTMTARPPPRRSLTRQERFEQNVQRFVRAAR